MVGVHYQGHGKSPRLGSRLGWANLVANAADAVDWAADHLDGPVVLLGSSQGGVLAMAVAAHSRRLALVAAHNLLDPSLPESLMISRLPGWLVGAYRPLLATLRLAARIARSCRCRSGRTWTWIGCAAGDPPAVPDRPFGAALLPAGVPGRAVHHGPVGDGYGGIGCPVLVIAARGSAVQLRLYPAGVRPDRGPGQGAAGVRG